MTDQVDPSARGRNWASDDELYEHQDEVVAVILSLGRLVDVGSVSEFGMGRGRLAVPWTDADCTVTGVEASPGDALAPSGAARRRRSPRSGDYTRGRRTGIVLIAFSTLFLVSSQSRHWYAWPTQSGTSEPEVTWS